MAKSRAVVTVRPGAVSTAEKAQQIADWLRMHARDLPKYGKQYAPAFRASHGPQVSRGATFRVRGGSEMSLGEVKWLQEWLRARAKEVLQEWAELGASAKVRHVWRFWGELG